MKVLVSQSCPTLCDPMDCNPSGSSVHGLLQARILEWVAIPFFRESFRHGLEPTSPALRAYSSPSELPGLERNQDRAGREHDVIQREGTLWAGLGHGLEAYRPRVSDQRSTPLAQQLFLLLG